MNLFEEVKAQVSARQIAEYYGYTVNRRGFICCPFHSEKTPSMKVDKRFHCFGCQADGDAIDFVANTHNIPAIEAAKKIAQDFGIHYDTVTCENNTESRRAKAVRQTQDNRLHEHLIHFWLVITEYRQLLGWYLECEAPKDPYQKWNDHFVCAALDISWVDYVIDSFFDGDYETKVDIFIDQWRNMERYDQEIRKIREFTSSQTI